MEWCGMAWHGVVRWPGICGIREEKVNLLKNIGPAIDEALEFARLRNIRGQSSVNEIQRINHQKRQSATYGSGQSRAGCVDKAGRLQFCIVTSHQIPDHDV